MRSSGDKQTWIDWGAIVEVRIDRVWQWAGCSRGEALVVKERGDLLEYQVRVNGEKPFTEMGKRR